MLTRRGFFACGLCAAAGFLATGVEAQTAGLERVIIGRMDGPAPGYETIEARVEIEPGFVIARHTHFGIENSYVVEGEIELAIDGLGSKTYKPGEGFQVPVGAIHGGKNGDKPAVLAGVYIVEKGKPLATPA
jgi:quercetin dioxygenase-like cupin family protein